MSLKQIAIYAVVALLVLKFRSQLLNGIAGLPAVGGPLTKLIG